MQYLRPSRAWFVSALLITLLLVTVAASTRNANQFDGFFDISGVQEQGELVQVTLHLKLFNHAQADARGVIVMLMESGPAPNLRGNFQPVKVWKSQQFIDLKQEFSVPKREFAEWMAAPGQPNLNILFQDSKGQTYQKGALISRQSLVPLPQAE
jgi:hypothetical protein